MRIHRRFNRAHDGDFRFTAHRRQPLIFYLADAVFGGDGSLASQHVLINDLVDRLFKTVRLVAENMRQEGVVVQAAVAQMAEHHDFDTGKRLLQSRRALFDKLGHPLDRHRNIVFDAGTQTALGGGNVFAQRPQILPLGIGGRQYTVFKTVFKQKIGQQLTQIFARHRIG